MTTNQQNSFGFQWGAQPSSNPPTSTSWGSTGSFGKPMGNVANTLGGSSQSNLFGQSTPGTMGQSTAASNPFGSSTLSGQNQGVQAGSGFGQANSFGSSTANFGGSFGQTRQTNAGSGFSFAPNQASVSSGFQQQASQNTGGLSFGAQSSNTVPPQSSFGASSTQMGRSGGFGGSSFGTTTNQSTNDFSFGQNKVGGQTNASFGFGSAQGPSSSFPHAVPSFGRPSTTFGSSAPGTTNPSPQLSGTSAFGSGTQNSTNAFGQQASASPFQFNVNRPAGGANLFGQVAQPSPSSGGNVFGSSGNPQSQGQPGFGGFGQQSNQPQGALFGTSSNVSKPPGGPQSTGGFGFGAQGAGSTTNLFSQQPAAQATPSTSTSFGQPFGSNAPITGTTNRYGTLQGSLQQGGFGASQPALNSQLGTQPKPFSFGSSQGQQNSGQTLGSQTFGTTVGSTSGGSSGLFGPAKSASPFGFPGANTASAQQTTLGSIAPSTASTASNVSTLSQTTNFPFASGSNPISSAQQSTAAPATGFSTSGASVTPSMSSNLQSSGSLLAPTVSTTNQTTTGSGTGVEITGDAKLFTFDSTSDGYLDQSALRADYTFIGKDEFERFHPLMKQILLLDNRTHVTHPEYPSRGFLIEPCTKERRNDLKTAMAQENPEVQDTLYPDSVRSEWTKCAKEAVRSDADVHPVPCASLYILGKRSQLHKSELDKCRSELQRLVDDLGNSKKVSVLNQQWLDGEYIQTTLKLHKEALTLQKQLLMLRYKGEALTDREKEFENFVDQIASVVHGKASPEVIAKYCCGTEFFQKLCGKSSIPDIVERFAAKMDDLKKDDENVGSDLDESQTVAMLEKLESIRVGTQAVLQLLEEDQNIVDKIESGEMLKT